MGEIQREIAEDIIRRVETNRKTINGLQHGLVVFRIYRGQLVQITASETLTLSAGEQLCPLLFQEEPNS